MELLLIGIGGCAGMDIVSILKKKKQDITGIEITIKGGQADTYPKKYTDISLEFIVRGKDISEEAVKRSIELSMNKYCHVKASLEGSAKVSFTYTVIQD
jgi:putative redox protein